MSQHFLIPKLLQAALILAAMILAWMISASWNADASPRHAGDDPVAIALLGPAPGR